MTKKKNMMYRTNDTGNGTLHCQHKMDDDERIEDDRIEEDGCFE